MRLKEDEKNALLRSIEEQTIKFKGTLYLFGSRAIDSKSGGDIDLALCLESSESADQFKKIDYKILAAMKLKKEIGFQKIDLKILSPEEVKTPFFVEALKMAVVLKYWE